MHILFNTFWNGIFILFVIFVIIDQFLLESITIEKIALGLEDTLWVTKPFQLVKGNKNPKISAP